MTGSVIDGRDTAQNEVIDALLGASRVFVGMAARSLASVDPDVTLPQYRTLVELVSRGPHRAVDLAQGLAVQPSTATRMCDRLIRKGLATRQERPDDRRAVWIAVTPAGARLVERVMRHRREEIAGLVQRQPIAQPRLLAAMLDGFVASAGEVSGSRWQPVPRDAGPGDAQAR